jgi:flagellar motor protein MotB
MRDPTIATEDPWQIAKRLNIDDIDFKEIIYQDLSPSSIKQRLEQRLKPPSTVELSIQGTTLFLSGHAPQDWLNKIDTIPTISGINDIERRNLMHTDDFLKMQAQHDLKLPTTVKLTVHNSVLHLTGQVNTDTFHTLESRLRDFQNAHKELTGYDMTGLIQVDKEIQRLIQHIEKTVIFFSKNEEPLPNQETILQELFRNIHYLFSLNSTLHLQIMGDTDGIGTKEYNQQLSQQRAQVIRDWLYARGVEKRRLTIVPPSKVRFGETETNTKYRKVNFQVGTEGKS